MKKKTKAKLNIGLWIVAAIVYVLIPMDIMPDAIPMAGWVDDLAVVLVSIANVIRIMSKLRGKK